MSAGPAGGLADVQRESQAERLRTFAHLAGLLEAELPGEVLARRLRVVIDERALRSDAGQVLALTVARLVPRLCDRIDFVAPAQPCLPRLRPLLIDEQFSGASLAWLARTIRPDGHFTCDSGESADYVLALGGCAGDICVGIDPDGAAVVAEQPCPIERPDSVFAALAAAGLGCAQTAKLLYPEIMRSNVDPFVRLDRGPFGGPLDTSGPVVLERPALAGVGAVGCALVYAMIAVGASGRLLLLDRDIVKDSNLMRYILFDTRHLGEAKVDAAKGLIEACGVDIEVDTDRKVIQAYLEANQTSVIRSRRSSPQSTLERLGVRSLRSYRERSSTSARRRATLRSRVIGSATIAPVWPAYTGRARSTSSVPP